MELLVSVRSAAEACAALQGGAGLIDVKEPAHGSLGSAGADTIEAVVRVVAGRRPVSAALGEIADAAEPKTGVGLAYVKWGLSRLGESSGWPQALLPRPPDPRRVSPELSSRRGGLRRLGTCECTLTAAGMCLRLPAALGRSPSGYLGQGRHHLAGLVVSDRGRAAMPVMQEGQYLHSPGRIPRPEGSACSAPAQAELVRCSWSRVPKALPHWSNRS